jgi:hypothetical protein
MSHNSKETLVPRYLRNGTLKATSEERKGLLSNLDAEDSGGEPPRYEDEKYPRRKRAPLRKNIVARVLGGLVALILGTVFLVLMSKSWCCRICTGRLRDPSRLVNNGTHEFKRTVLIISIDGLR